MQTYIYQTAVRLQQDPTYPSITYSMVAVIPTITGASHWKVLLGLSHVLLNLLIAYAITVFHAYQTFLIST